MKDKFKQGAIAGVLTVLAVTCLFSGCRVLQQGNNNTEATTDAPTSTVQKIQTDEATVEEITATEMTCLTEEETRPEFLDLGKFKLTAYCPCSECCGKWADGITATGTVAVQGRTIAVDEDVIPYGSEVIVNGRTYIAEDCGGAIIGKEIDIYFDSHEDAEEFGVQYSPVLLKVGDSE